MKYTETQKVKHKMHDMVWYLINNISSYLEYQIRKKVVQWFILKMMIIDGYPLSDSLSAFINEYSIFDIRIYNF